MSNKLFTLQNENIFFCAPFRPQSHTNRNDKMSRWGTSWHSISLAPQNITFFVNCSFFGQIFWQIDIQVAFPQNVFFLPKNRSAVDVCIIDILITDMCITDTSVEHKGCVPKALFTLTRKMPNTNGGTNFWWIRR